ncbi:MAG: InlB B-repeat-containing protein, partial [Lachnospiraceae bacterium]|nr:InlB B-repeat-containing protein [Lachnospiraceae bacterium]
MEQAPENTFESSSVITLLSDVTEDVMLYLVPEGNGWDDLSLTLDLNGYTLTGAGTTTADMGGAIYIYRGTSYSDARVLFTLKNGTVTGGVATGYAGAGAVYFSGAQTDGTLTFENVVFTGNTGVTAGAVAGSGAITAVNCTFTGNTSTAGAGAIYSAVGSDLTLTNCVITGNSGVTGGGIRVYRTASSDETLDLSSGNNAIYGNTASEAGDDILIQASGGSGTLTGSLADASVLAGGTVAGLYVDGTYDDASIGEGTRYSEGNRTLIEAALQLCYHADSELMRTVGIKVVPTVYTVTYTDGTGETLYFADETYTAYANESTPAFQGSTDRAHYTFEGWEPALADTVTEDVTYTASWTENQYTITLDVNGGSLGEGVADTMTVTYGTLLSDLPTPVLEGSVFEGWFDADGNEYTAESVYELDADLTLTAKWSTIVARYESTGECFTTLQAAFDAVEAAYEAYAPTGEMEESSVITLLADVTENVELSLVPTTAGWSNVNLTLDLNGYTLSGTGDTSSTKGIFYLFRGTSYGGTYLYLTVKDGTLANGYSSSYAGAIYGYGSYVYVTCENVSFINNTGKYGAICSHSVTLHNCTFTGNTGTSYAGAVYSPAGNILSMTNCTITGNSGVLGGGVYIARGASSNTTFEIDASNVIYNNT